MADCRSLIEFLRAFEHRRRRAAAAGAGGSSDYPPCPRSRRAPTSSSSRRQQQQRRLFPSLCDHSPMAALDALALLAVLGALAFLAAPYVTLLALEVGELLRQYPDEPYLYVAFAAGAGAAVAAVAGLLAWEVAGHHARKCGKPRCRGLRKAVEFDIQLETEECVRGRLLPVAGQAALLAAAGAARPVELGDEHRELEAELRKMAPPNGRTVLTFRAPCGCPKGRMEVWGAKKVRRIKK
ncbi:uncharacterized protein At5g19025-like [Brachypodium distachyon]|uniref:Ribosomal protein L34e superfamily protein n=1 Tax=Brachypodium distachyon TaxID=15368 RepID=I1HI97_BRADI|nr:uncharacterized protein At5g19025-like [Brachypodium distachyon]KQK05687.1 hypothetical protein BRADI_2g21890v3 [Brachypodium distachyon]|eukprot:XP_024315322.1 uncharacterized protein At5g19025-like [Brachypodium distachyon]